MRRGKEEIIEIILDTCKEPANKTKVVYQINLNFRITNQYLSILIDSGHLEASKASSVTYKTTPKGIELLELMKAVNAGLGRETK